MRQAQRALLLTVCGAACSLATAQSADLPGTPPPRIPDEPCTLATPSGAAAHADGRSPDAHAPSPGSIARVSGMDAPTAAFDRGVWRAGELSISTPLPEGYPAPTPPGAIEIKTYPSVRRAEFSASMETNSGRNVGFWPLFQHISRRDIAMTAPVEMDYHGLEPMSLDNLDNLQRPSSWTMSFLYRTTDDGPAGPDERNDRVRVVDTEPVTVLAAGYQGVYTFERDANAMTALVAWLDANPQWEPAGEMRALYYHGPDTPWNKRWAEVQVPIRPRVPGTDAEAAGNPARTSEQN